MFTFIDRLGNSIKLDPVAGETIASCLRRHDIPPASVLSECGGDVLPDSHRIGDDQDIVGRLIEGYNIGEIRAALAETRKSVGTRSYHARRIMFDIDGSLRAEAASLDPEALVNMVCDTVTTTICNFRLIGEGDRVLIGLSGGVDSGALLIALQDARARLPEFELCAVTFEDYDSESSPTYAHAHALARDLGIEHHVAPASLVEKAFGLNRPLRDVLPELMQTADHDKAMYIDHHTTRRGLELFAESRGINKIALGLHTTDLLAGLLNSIATGYSVGPVPLRRVGSIDYIYPLSFLQKKVLHLYHYHKQGTLARHSFPNSWEQNPLDRNFYYFLADMMQEYWPGLENYILSSHNWRLRREKPLTSEACGNCGATLLIQPFMPAGQDECEACQILQKHGFRT
ncbi:asparagine synthase-related protein [Bauldia litoralis]|uniref:tRNA(Ile)-lysidine synthase TilS/MesJ n=1 Tax=Bauldia litoralis TaxID=665467 RepID=A0A1G6EN19_9HYPH|nr:asparagine synthase-related protein [Bauldia litoralis]SDB58901.1 tRNA(Ile)-lysidine synthase TilS/MesJ [Bauldia litoralis]